MVHVYELNSNGRITMFHVQACAELFKQLQGGTIRKVELQHGSFDQTENRQVQAQ